ncbi:TFP11-domain-containing protein [Aulographum hederae CBS 113979]|uniref:TFP11-domain-containing protein n=1 Tax=Aulographum hederae CBS 113979 TaxID=1176131 RepID=A0A6G1HFY1_9PEZI|nr:TFP11-domain-containing protein [Aulographum hederae CBS 113979]
MSFAERMMAKMGYEGGGLGAKGNEGIQEAIQVKQRPQGVGLGSVKEKTDQAKAEDRKRAEKRGEQYEDSSDEEKERRRKARQKAKQGGGTGAAKAPKPKFKTAHQIEATGLHVPSVLTSLIDATGKQTDMPSMSLVESETEKMARRARQDVDSFARAWDEIQDRKSSIAVEQMQYQDSMTETESEVHVLESIISLAEDVQSAMEWDTTLDTLDMLYKQYSFQIDSDTLAELAIGAVIPLVRNDVGAWDPLIETNKDLANNLLRLQKSLGISQNNALNAGDPFRIKCAPYESLISNLFLPIFRRATMNFNPRKDPWPMLDCLLAYRDVLSSTFPYIMSLVAAKLVDAVEAYKPRKDTLDFHTWVFPFLQFLPDYYTEQLLASVVRKLRVVLDTCDLSRGAVPGLSKWRDIMSVELDKALIRHMLPRLSAVLKSEFEVNPADQDISALEKVFAWNDWFKPEVTARLLLANGIFAQLHETLHVWLTGDPNFEEVGQWISWWKSVFPAKVNEVPAVKEAWETGLHMINAALDLPPEDRKNLPAPSQKPADAPGTLKATASVKEAPSAKSKREEEATFRDVIQDWCSEENLLFMPLREAHESTGLPLFRITANATGRGGVIVYIKGDVVWAQNRKNRSVFEPVGLDEALVQKAEGK